MGQVKGFIMSLVCASAASALIDGFVPDGGIKKYVRYLISLSILLVLLSPLKSVLTSLPSLVASGNMSYESVEAMTRANSVISANIEDTLVAKFSLSPGEVDVFFDDGKIIVKARRRMGLFEEDILLFIRNTYGAEAQVTLYE